MIARLKGIIATILPHRIILDVNGVGYEVFMPSNALSTVQVGDVAVVEIITVIREDAFMLFGFLNYADKQWFEILTGVQGVGAKVALAIQSVLSADDLYVAVMSADTTAFARANGVGPKLASRIVLELKDKVAKLPADMSINTIQRGKTIPKGMGNTAVVTDAVSALTNLGFGRSDAVSAVQTCLKGTDDTVTTEHLIKAALSILQG